MENEITKNPIATSALDSLEFIKKVDEYIESKKEAYIESLSSDAIQSEETDKLNAALANAQGDFPEIEANKQVGHLRSNYASYNAIMKAVKKVLKENELSIKHSAIIGKKYSVLVSVLGHSSGQWVTNKARIITEKDGMLGYKAALSGLKRVAVMNLLNITTEDQE